MNAANRTVRVLRGAGGASQSALLAPAPDLSGLIRAYLSRSTTALPSLAERDRWNCFPPVPACVFVWVLEGHDSRLSNGTPGASAGAPRLPVVFSGPHVRPSLSVNRGAVRFFTMLMYPDAVRALAGLAIEPHIGRYTRLEDLFDSGWRQMAGQVLEAGDDMARIGHIETFLRERRHALQAPLPMPVQPWTRLDAWSSDVERRARGAMLSPRQCSRRIKAWTGLTLRELQGIGRMERALIEANTMGRTGSSWSDIALDCGFADQAHLCREFRRHLGMRPSDVRLKLDEDSHWVLRLWS